MLLPIQILADEGETVIVFTEFTVTMDDCLLVQPFEAVPVTVYVMLVLGFAVTFAPVVVFNPVDGVHA